MWSNIKTHTHQHFHSERLPHYNRYTNSSNNLKERERGGEIGLPPSATVVAGLPGPPAVPKVTNTILRIVGKWLFPVSVRWELATHNNYWLFLAFWKDLATQNTLTRDQTRRGHSFCLGSLAHWKWIPFNFTLLVQTKWPFGVYRVGPIFGADQLYIATRTVRRALHV